MLSESARFRRAPRSRSRRAVDAPDDPSGPHHFGRRAHHPDPNGHYGFAMSPARRTRTATPDPDMPAPKQGTGAAGED